jgi:hypothetical protein
MKQLRIARVIALVMVAMALCAAPAQAQSRDLSVEDLRNTIRAIAVTNDLREATGLYASVATRAGRSRELHEVFMRKMLEMELPNRASGAARALVRIDPNNGMAWGVLGYYDTNKDQVARGFKETIEAVALMPHDSNLLYNLGQAAAWYDLEGAKARFDSGAVATLEQHRALWSQNGAFQEGLNRIERGKQHHEALIAEVEDEIEEIADEVGDLSERHEEIQDELADVRARIDDIERLVAIYMDAVVDDAAPGSGAHPLLVELGEAQKLLIQLLMEKEDLEYRMRRLGNDRKDRERRINVLQRERIKNFRLADGWLEFRAPVYDRSQPVLAGLDLNQISEGDIIVINYGTIDTGADVIDNRDADFLTWWDDHSDTEAEALEAEEDPAFDEKTAAALLKQVDRHLDRHELDEARTLLEKIISTHRKTDSAQAAKLLLQGLG